MVRILRKRGISPYMWRNIHLNKSRMIIFFTLLVLAFMLFIMNRYPYASIGLMLIPVSYGLGLYTYKNYLAWIGGVTGERAVGSVLKRLGDEFILISGVVIPPNHGDTDHIVVGPNGIFVIESKNYGGEISCDGDEWSRRKIGRAGGVYQLEIGSPSRQVKRNAKVLKDFILRNQDKLFAGKAPHIWVNGILVFTNSASVLYINNPTVPVKGVAELTDFIKKAGSESAYSADEVSAIGNLIIEHSR